MKKNTRILRQELFFPILISIHFILWFIDINLYTGSYAFSSKHIAGEVLSSWVVTVFAANFIMATRAHWVERLFGGLDKMYLIHRRSGMIAMVLLILHFIVVPRDPVYTIGKPLGFYSMILILIGVILAAVPLFKRIIKYNKWLNFHKLMGPFYILGIAHSLNVSTLTSQLPIVRSYVYGMALIGIAAWIYKAFLYNLFNKKLKYKVDNLKRFSNDILEIILSPQNKELSFKAGQFAFVSFKGISRQESHPFTISNHPSEGKLRFTIKSLGDYTANLQTALKDGTAAKVEGPFGEFNFKKAKYKKQLWLAGGIGITPYLSFLGEVDPGYDITLVWSVRTANDANYREEIEAVTTEKAFLKYILNDSETQGQFTIEKLYQSADLKDQSIFICGPDVMRESYIRQLLEKGVSIRDIHYEEFSFR